jgi:hypothetical protein
VTKSGFDDARQCGGGPDVQLSPWASSISGRLFFLIKDY